MTLAVIGPEAVEGRLEWRALTRALEAGHARPRPELADVFMTRHGNTMLSRHAWVDGLGIAVKVAQVFPGNAERGLPTVDGAMLLFDDATGAPEALLDFRMVTRWKTAGDSLLAGLHLARPDSREVLILGAGTVAGSMIEAWHAGFPEARFTIWNRTRARAEALAARWSGRLEVAVAEDLPEAVGRADIITAATMSTEPLIRGEWLRPGQHLDLIGAFRADMREADDEALRRARIFVDCRETVLEHIGELADPIARGVIAPEDVVADFYDLPSGRFARRSADEITLFKNGGGAHLDLMTARWILEVWRSAGA
ncbi:MAG: ornithine cyclodeaminase [Alphaproteobacteria bacterium]|nr:MAG: ornithine cyclodeaminase [Alphaproteobacteria bacterium]